MSSSESEGNAYLNRVVAQQAALEVDLKSSVQDDSTADTPNATSPVTIRIKGWGRWKTVIVPPNAFVVHTRRGHSEPIHIGLGVSFKFNPFKDSFLVVPGTMQTIILSAYCICRELQGVVVQAYVQWIVEDIATAYRKLDFADRSDPMRLVNIQLREQAEAAIKDKVATLGVHEVLSDKQPIIEELTARLRAVAEENLGLRIVTVQIKEAIVSSTRLWENLQKPYRAEQSQAARLAELGAEEIISARQALNVLKSGERAEEDARKLAKQRDETKVHAIKMEQERHALEVEIASLRLGLEHQMEQLRQDFELASAQAKAENAHAIKLLEIERARLRAEIANTQSPEAIQARLVESLPDIVSRLPKPTELKTISMNGTGDVASLTGIIASLREALRALP